MSTKALVSVIMAAYNTERYIAEAVRSVIQQTHDNWELLVVNDGSTDGTAAVLAGFHDPRIKVFHKSNGGIGSARNMALDHATGDFLCCLDSDDVLPEKSLEARLSAFHAEPALDIVDGRVLFMNESITLAFAEYMPAFKGNVFHELLRFSGRCFMGPSWMIRWSTQETLRYDESVSHGEDLLFCLLYCRNRVFGFTPEIVLWYRRSGTSSMTKDFKGMERSFRTIGQILRSKHLVNNAELRSFTAKRRRIMAGTFWHAGQYWSAVQTWFH